MSHTFRCISLNCFALFTALAQTPRVAPENLHERVYLIVPMTGAGTYLDPRRPALLPSPPEAAALDSARVSVGGEGTTRRSGILGYGYQVSDDGSTALVEVALSDRAAIAALLQSTAARALGQQLRSFTKGAGNRAEMLAEFRKLKKDFDPETLKVVVP